MKKKMLFMATSMNVGGVEKSLLSLLAILPSEKYDVTLLLLEKKGDFLEYIPSWVKVVEVDWYKDIKPVLLQPPQDTVKNFYNRRQFMKMIKFIFVYIFTKYSNNRYFFYKHLLRNVPAKLNTFDVAISYQGPTDIIDFFILNKVSSPKKISWVHFDVSKHQINVELYKKLYVKYNHVFVVSSEGRKKLIEKFPYVKSKTKVVRNIISNRQIEEMATMEVDFDPDFQGVKVLTVGRLAAEKGQDLAIRVLKRLRSEGYNVRWYCIGEGKKRREYEELISKLGLEKYFILLGSNTNPYPYILKSDIYVQTSRHEGYCLTLAEALCLKKPIITTNFIGAYEQVTNGINGWIVNPSEEEIYEKLKDLLDHPGERETLVNNLPINHFNDTAQINLLSEIF
jgi:glycosyltransferase involved in cell wall biosynthesis